MSKASFLITVTLDGVPGAFHTPESWLEHFKQDEVLPSWYNPEVEIIPRPQDDIEHQGTKLRGSALWTDNSCAHDDECWVQPPYGMLYFCANHGAEGKYKLSEQEKENLAELNYGHPRDFIIPKEAQA